MRETYEVFQWIEDTITDKMMVRSLYRNGRYL